MFNNEHLTYICGHYKKRALKTMAQSYYQVKKAFLKCNVMTEF